MKEQEMMNYGGDILKELQEYNMLMDEAEQVVVYADTVRQLFGIFDNHMLLGNERNEKHSAFVI